MIEGCLVIIRLFSDRSAYFLFLKWKNSQKGLQKSLHVHGCAPCLSLCCLVMDSRRVQGVTHP